MTFQYIKLTRTPTFTMMGILSILLQYSLGFADSWVTQKATNPKVVLSSTIQILHDIPTYYGGALWVDEKGMPWLLDDTLNLHSLNQKGEIQPKIVSAPSLKSEYQKAYQEDPRWKVAFRYDFYQICSSTKEGFSLMGRVLHESLAESDMLFTDSLTPISYFPQKGISLRYATYPKGDGLTATLTSQLENSFKPQLVVVHTQKGKVYAQRFVEQQTEPEKGFAEKGLLQISSLEKVINIEGLLSQKNGDLVLAYRTENDFWLAGYNQQGLLQDGKQGRALFGIRGGIRIPGTKELHFQTIDQLLSVDNGDFLVVGIMGNQSIEDFDSERGMFAVLRYTSSGLLRSEFGENGKILNQPLQRRWEDPRISFDPNTKRIYLFGIIHRMYDKYNESAHSEYDDSHKETHFAWYCYNEKGKPCIEFPEGKMVDLPHFDQDFEFRDMKPVGSQWWVLGSLKSQREQEYESTSILLRYQLSWNQK